MPDTGFAIRCPHCQRWNIQKNVILDEKVIIATEDEMFKILKDLTVATEQGKPGNFSHPKLWRCINPTSFCTASFEAFICRTDANALKFSEDIESWSLKRNFRLYKADCETRWEGKYYGILFNTQPVMRLPHAELSLLMNRELVSRLIVGIGFELEAPLTIYSANIFTPPSSSENPKKPCVYWMPIEAYSQGKLLVPPLYNALCYTCRSIVMQKLTDTFERENYSVHKCPIEFANGGLCAGRAPACMKEPNTRDWNLCPAFIEERLKWDPCYKSDFSFIQNIIKDLKDKLRLKGEFEEENLPHYSQRCLNKFHERAIPIVVHGYLVGVAITGQVFFKPNDIADVSAFCKNLPMLSGSEQILQKAKSDLVANETERKGQNKSRFLITDEQLEKRVSLLADSIARMTRTATSRYKDLRGRAEWFFRQEILGFIQDSKTRRIFPDVYVLQVLDRMRVFWAFEAVYLTAFFPLTHCISVISLAHKYRTSLFFGIPGKVIGQNVKIGYDVIHPAPYLYKKGARLPTDRNPLIDELRTIFSRIAEDRDLQIPIGDESFLVVIPFLGDAYNFILPVRDDQIMGQIEHRVAGGVSRLCQDSILETCIDVIYEFIEERYYQEHKRAWLEFSAHASHRIGNEISSVGTLLDVLADQLIKDPKWEPMWKDKLSVMQGCIKACKEMLSDLTVLVAQITPQPKLTNLLELVKRASLGVLPEQTNLDLQHLSPDIVILVDPNLMEQAFRELCTNAARVSGEHIRLTVAAKKDKDTLSISFHDNGPGIADEKAERIFEPFVTFQSGRTGLGLATVHRIIEAHGGSIRLQKSRIGACFIISLPFERIEQK